MKVVRDAILTCSTCGVEGPHELLYLSEHLRASRCVNCGKTQTYSGHIYVEYARDLAGRTGSLPVRFAREAFKLPADVISWPFKALRKPFRLLKEVDQVRHPSNGAAAHPRPGSSFVSNFRGAWCIGHGLRPERTVILRIEGQASCLPAIQAASPVPRGDDRGADG